MNVYFYLNTEEETEIVIYDLEANPFKLGDEVNLSIDELEDNEELCKKFNRKKIKLVREDKYVSFKTAQKASIVIEYHCDIVEE